MTLQTTIASKHGTRRITLKSKRSSLLSQLHFNISFFKNCSIPQNEMILSYNSFSMSSYTVWLSAHPNRSDLLIARRSGQGWVTKAGFTKRSYNSLWLIIQYHYQLCNSLHIITSSINHINNSGSMRNVIIHSTKIKYNPIIKLANCRMSRDVNNLTNNTLGILSTYIFIDRRTGNRRNILLNGGYSLRELVLSGLSIILNLQIPTT